MTDHKDDATWLADCSRCGEPVTPTNAMMFEGKWMHQACWHKADAHRERVITGLQDDKQDRIDAAFGVNAGASQLRKIADAAPKYGPQDDKPDDREKLRAERGWASWGKRLQDARQEGAQDERVRIGNYVAAHWLDTEAGRLILAEIREGEGEDT